LSVCQGIVASHGGEISVDSEMGKGSTFRVRLPVFAEGVQVARSRDYAVESASVEDTLDSLRSEAS
ncbi:two-component sensor histidine kinase, partial [Pyxidicoccus fallax]